MREKVLDWIRKTGFPLEMEAAQAFRRAGFEIHQSFGYPDPEEGKGREVDVLAEDPDLLGVIEISHVLECKSSSKPWVVLTADDAVANYSAVFAFAMTSKAARDVTAQHVIHDGPMKTLISRSTKCGYGFRQALSGNSDKAYAAAMGAIKACVGLTRDRESSAIPRLAFSFPVIVVDSPLFECTMSEYGELHLEEVGESEFFFSAHLPESTGCCIKVVKKDRLGDFAKRQKDLSSRIREALAEEEDNAFESARKA